MQIFISRNFIRSEIYLYHIFLLNIILSNVMFIILLNFRAGNPNLKLKRRRPIRKRKTPLFEKPAEKENNNPFNLDDIR